jgi:hypothetical protein
LAALPVGSFHPQICTLNDNFYNIQYTIYIGKESAVVDSQATEAGLINKRTHYAKTSWRYENLSNTHLATGNIFQTDTDSTDYFAFSMSHLKVAFYLCVAVCSVLMITGEMLFSGFVYEL